MELLELATFSAIVITSLVGMAVIMRWSVRRVLAVLNPVDDWWTPIGVLYCDGQYPRGDGATQLKLTKEVMELLSARSKLDIANDLSAVFRNYDIVLKPLYYKDGVKHFRHGSHGGTFEAYSFKKEGLR